MDHLSSTLIFSYLIGKTDHAPAVDSKVKLRLRMQPTCFVHACLLVVFVVDIFL